MRLGETANLYVGPPLHAFGSIALTHWYDELFLDAKAFVGEKKDLVINGGLSVSGLQHVGRLRGEITLAQLLTRSFRDEGRKATQSLVLYTQDEWKSKEGQLSQFPDDEGKKYIGRRLIDVPDPKGCHKNWVEHYWVDFGGVLDRFTPDIRIVSTTDAYKSPEMQTVVRDIVSRAEAVRAVVNKYRARHPYPQGWLPFEAFCEHCGKIGAKTVALSGKTAEYECPKCGARSKSSIEKGKLNWRLEWPALWKVYHVDIEPFGKDHATPGGSRDSCKEICEAILNTRAPMGIPYEWVAQADRGKELGDMGSSDFIGFTPRAWIGIGDPEVLRYVYAFNPIFRRIVIDLSRVDGMHDTYDRAEQLFFADEREGDEDDQARSYELAALGPIPEDEPFQLSYRHASFLAQISPEDDRLGWCLRRMRDTGLLDQDLTDWERERVARRLEQSRTWVETYVPENKVVLLEALSPEVEKALDDRDRAALRAYLDRASKAEWTEEAIKESMVSLTKVGKLPVETGRFFRDLYLVLLGKERGPRAAPFLAVLEKDWVLKRLRDAVQ